MTVGRGSEGLVMNKDGQGEEACSERSKSPSENEESPESEEQEEQESLLEEDRRPPSTFRKIAYHWVGYQPTFLYTITNY